MSKTKGKPTNGVGTGGPARVWWRPIVANSNGNREQRRAAARLAKKKSKR